MSQGIGLRTGTNHDQPRAIDASRISLAVEKAVDDGMVEALASDMALAVRACMSTSIAVSHPLAYATALDVMVGSEQSERALSFIGKRLHRVEAELGQDSWSDFVESIVALRNRYSTETIKNSR